MNQWVTITIKWHEKCCKRWQNQAIIFVSWMDGLFTSRSAWISKFAAALQPCVRRIFFTLRKHVNYAGASYRCVQVCVRREIPEQLFAVSNKLARGIRVSPRASSSFHDRVSNQCVIQKKKEMIKQVECLRLWWMCIYYSLGSSHPRVITLQL